MEYLNEEHFKDLDKFIEECTETQAAIGDINVVEAAIEASELIPVQSKIPYAGKFENTDETTIEYFQMILAQGAELSEQEKFQYGKLIEEHNISTKE